MKTADYIAEGIARAAARPNVIAVRLREQLGVGGMGSYIEAGRDCREIRLDGPWVWLLRNEGSWLGIPAEHVTWVQSAAVD